MCFSQVVSKKECLHGYVHGFVWISVDVDVDGCVNVQLITSARPTVYTGAYLCVCLLVCDMKLVLSL